MWNQQGFRRKSTILLALVFLALAYWGFLYFLHGVTGTKVLDGVIGVLLGLYICSHPAAYTIDVVFFQRGALRDMASDPTGLRWLMLNTVALVVGWVVIVVGATQLVGGNT